MRHDEGGDGDAAARTRRSLRNLRAGAALAWSQRVFGGPAPDNPGRQNRLASAGLLGLAAVLLFTYLDGPLLDPDEGRHAEVPREMLAHRDLLVPRFLGVPYFEKPPLQYWLTAGVYSLLGVRAQSARLVPAAAAWLTLLVSLSWGRRSLGGRVALTGAGVLCLSVGFILVGRTVLLDSLLSFWVVASWFAAHRAVDGPCLRWRWWLASATACGLGVLTKGPVAVALLVPPVAAYQILNGRAPRFRSWLVFGAIVAAVAAPWYAAMAVRQPGYLEHFLWKDNVLRFVRPFDHPQPVWFYVPVLAGLTYPWCLLWPALAYFLAGRDPRLRALRPPALGFCTLAAGWCFLFFSLSGCKSPPYLAPALAPLALLVGACLEAVVFRPLACLSKWLAYVPLTLPRWTTLVLLWGSSLFLVAPSALGWEDPGWPAPAMGGLLAAAAVWWRRGWRLRPAAAWGGCMAATVALLVAALHLDRGYAARHSPASVARWARHTRQPAADPLFAYGRDCPSATFYFRRDFIPCVYEEYRSCVPDFVGRGSEVLVLVENGRPLRDLLAALPRGAESEVRLPERAGQTALVRVRSRPSADAVARDP